ncbi:hypothetical protein B0H10DRAFT_2095932 [Mycena sp. CBHHK59/15]|nr:hypothetical protein B0H10DRAFT_2095932 [Mycena sp. CBHHK59/15]
MWGSVLHTGRRLRTISCRPETAAASLRVEAHKLKCKRIPLVVKWRTICDTAPRTRRP